MNALPRPHVETYRCTTYGCEGKVRLPLSADPGREVLCRKCKRAQDAADACDEYTDEDARIDRALADEGRTHGWKPNWK